MNDLKTNRKPFDLWTKYESDSFTRRLAYFCAGRSGRYAETLQHLVSVNDHEGLCNTTIEYRCGDSALDLAYARQTLGFYSKDADLKLCDTRDAMVRSFISTEMQCRSTNKRLSSMFQDGTLEFHCDSIVFKLRRKILEILGDAPQLCDLPLSFGPGVNVGLTKEETSPRWKLRAVPTHTVEMQASMEEVARELPHLFDIHKGVTVVANARLSSVPKNAFTDRSIIVEPILNGIFQKGVGSVLKTKLLAFGCNLFQQSKNQQLALRGSVDNSLVTLDIKNASNTVSLLLVYHLLPEDWFNLLDRLRAHRVDVGEGLLLNLEMFSSMGNGFTFELESLIFYALALVIADENQVPASDISVFGDDIIVPIGLSARYKKCATFLGFTVNDSKSFEDGPFRESCGHDYFQGSNIRPFYKRDRWTNARVVGLLNHDIVNYDLFRDIRRDLELHVSHCFPYGPLGYGDGVIGVVPSDPFYLTCFRRCNRTLKQQFKSGVRDGRLFDYISKVPLKDFKRYQSMSLNDRVFPLYDISLKPERGYGPNLFNLGKDGNQRWVLKYIDGSINRAVNDIGSILTLGLKGLSGRESDPYVMKGGFKSRVSSVYVLPGHV